MSEKQPINFCEDHASLNAALERLSRSKFRSSFKLTKADIAYAQIKGRDLIQCHARDFVLGRLASFHPNNDGKQTPMKGHPVFRAMHACACCCRGCLEKWHHIPQGRPLSSEEREWIVVLLMAWIDAQMLAAGGYETDRNAFADKGAKDSFASGVAFGRSTSRVAKGRSINGVAVSDFGSDIAKPARSKSQCPGQETLEL